MNIKIVDFNNGDLSRQLHHSVVSKNIPLSKFSPQFYFEDEKLGGD